MSKMEHNASYIFIPFQYRGKDDFRTLMKDAENVSFSNQLFFGYIGALYKQAMHVKLNDISDGAEEVELVLFGTGIGFLLVKYIFVNGADGVSEQENKVRTVLEQVKADNYEILNQVKNKLPDTVFFPASVEKNPMVYNVLISKISNAENCCFTAGSECIHKIDRLHECYCSANQLSLVTNQHYSNLCQKSEDAEGEQKFRNKFEQTILLLLLLLHHERRAYLIYREMIVVGGKKETKKLKKLKSGILDLLSCYSFKLVSEDVEVQQVYSKYREVLGVTEYEDALSDLVFRLDDELDKEKDKKFNNISMIIAVLGMLQLISVVLDIISFF